MDVPSFGVAAVGKKTERSIDFSKILFFGPSVVAIVVSVLIGVFVVWPKFGEVQELKTTNVNFEETADKLEKKVEALKRLDKNLLTKQLVAAEELLPSEKAIFKFIRLIENVRGNTGVVFTTLSVGTVGQFTSGEEKANAEAGGAEAGVAPVAPPATAPADPSLADVSQVSMKVSIVSDFDQIFKFLNELYALPRVTTVSGLSFAIDQEGRINTNMDISSLWQERPKALPDVEAELATLTEAEIELLSKIETGSTLVPFVEIPESDIGKSNIFSAN